MPLELSAAIFIGGLLNWSTLRRRHRTETLGSGGLLYASGLITGEALMGILVAAAVVLLRPLGIALPLLGDRMAVKLPLVGISWGTAAGAAALAWVLLSHYRAAMHDDQTGPGRDVSAK